MHVEESLSDKIKNIMEKFSSMKGENEFDLSKNEDLFFAVTNLINIEEHLSLTAYKSENNGYYKFLLEARSIRKKLMMKLVKNNEGENWCVSKHLMAAFYRTMEYATKLLDSGNEKMACGMYDSAYEIYTLFWMINLGMELPTDVDTTGIMKKINEMKKSTHNDEDEIVVEFEKNKQQPYMKKFKKIIMKIVNCCIE